MSDHFHCQRSFKHRKVVCWCYVIHNDKVCTGSGGRATCRWKRWSHGGANEQGTFDSTPGEKAISFPFPASLICPRLCVRRDVFSWNLHNIADLKISFKHVFRPRKFGSCSEILYFRKYNRCSCSLSILESQQDLSLGRQVEDGVICDPSGDILLENVNFTVQPDSYTIPDPWDLARSRLDRSRFSRPNTHFLALFFSKSTRTSSSREQILQISAKN